MEWQKNTYHSKMFVTGADKSCEDLLPWFIENYRKHNPDIPLTVCDFGLSIEASRYINSKADYVVDYELHENCSWFLKPQTLIDVNNAEKKVWIDIDCEIMGDISEIFDYIEDGKIATAPDRYHSWGCKCQTGVFGVKEVPPILTVWAEACVKPTNRGDQEILWDIIKNKPQNQCWIPEEFNWLRIALERGNDISDKKIVHWTGEAGKKIIRKKIKK